jgi:NADH dehydrogenase
MDRHVTTVFGGSGFVGRHVVRRLAARDTIVRVAVRDPVAAEFLKPMGEIGQIVPVAADIRDSSTVAAAVEGATEVINLVGILYERGKATFQRVHVEGASTVARIAAESDVKSLVHISALGADPDGPSEYARSKATGEAGVLAAFPGAAIMRPSIVFGPEDNFFNLFAGMIRLLPVLPVFGAPALPRIRLFSGGKLISMDCLGEGGTKFQPVYVGDVADAIVAALERDDARGQTYALGGPRVYSSKEMMELLLQYTGRRRWLVPAPFWALAAEAWFLEKLPVPLITRDQVKQLRRHNAVPGGMPGLKDLGIAATDVEAILPTYLGRYRLPRRRRLGRA